MSEFQDKWFQIVVNKTQEIKILIDELFIQAIAHESVEKANKTLTSKNKILSKENKRLGSERLAWRDRHDRLAQRVVNAEEEIRKQNPTLDRCDRHEGFDNDCPICHAMNPLHKNEKQDA